MKKIVIAILTMIVFVLSVGYSGIDSRLVIASEAGDYIEVLSSKDVTIKGFIIELPLDINIVSCRLFISDTTVSFNGISMSSKHSYNDGTRIKDYTLSANEVKNENDSIYASVHIRKNMNLDKYEQIILQSTLYDNVKLEKVLNRNVVYEVINK